MLYEVMHPTSRGCRFCRLPTSTEWIYAAQGGTSSPYWWGGVMEPGMARCRGCNPGQPDDGPAPVVSYPPNPYSYNFV